MLPTLVKRFQSRRFLKNRPFKNKNCLWRPCLLAIRDEMSILYRRHSKDAFYLIHLGTRFQRRLSKHLYTGPSIDASYQVSVHWTKRFQRRKYLDIDHSEIRIACGGHVCKRIRTKLAILIEDLPKMLSPKSWLIWERGFRGENYQENGQPETRINCDDHVCKRIRTKLAIFIENLP
jgi:hypothetical protein